MSAPPSPPGKKMTLPSVNSSGAGFDFYLGQRRQVREDAQRRAPLDLVRALGAVGGE